jgi:hypothetical protein
MATKKLLPKIKTINVPFGTWQKLMDLKNRGNFDNVGEVVSALVLK